ncbi:hypothetical protein ACFVYA_30085 [Amycolatopsis sp. NPDC058278]|uniref:hypothetical protein n=1 Tax=Amycolatopsis sp. NPDC058278 TaxID=3346417 RepID=UPI0036D8C255
MKYQVLGPVAAILGGRPVPLGGPKPRAVLAALLLQANQVVSEQRLYSLVWGTGQGIDRGLLRVEGRGPAADVHGRAKRWYSRS